MSEFKGKNVLITGAGSGIGLLMAGHILKEQANSVIIWDINLDNMQSAKKQLQNEHTAIIGQQVDVSNTDQVVSAAERLLADFGSIDILINNAGIVVGGPFSDIRVQQIEKTININLLGVMQVARAFLPAMQKQQSGHIVNIASAAGLMANPNMSVYAASKWGVLGWSESLRIELEQQQSNIRVTTIEPGYIKTGMFKGVTPPLFTPLLEPDDISKRIIRAVKRNDIHLRAPFMVKLLPFLRGVMPTRMFDFIAGKLFGVYHSMDSFTGRKTE